MMFSFRVNIILTKTWNSKLKASKVAVPIYMTTGSTKPDLLELLKGNWKPFVASKTKLIAAKILDMARELNEKAGFTKRPLAHTRLQSSRLMGNLFLLRRMSGRRNAVDKVIRCYFIEGDGFLALHST